MKKAGILLHISSLNSDFGCGTFGEEAYRFADFLYSCGFKIWQVLPFNIPNRDGSPYSSRSFFYQNPLFIDPKLLNKDGFLNEKEINNLKSEVSYYNDNCKSLIKHRNKYLKIASKRAFFSDIKNEVYTFINEKDRILDAVHFMCKNPDNEEDFFFHAFVQYEFFKQYNALYKYLKIKDIEIIGDIPFYSDLSSCEVMLYPQNFMLREDKTPIYVSGVPGDDFNDKGQKWGHPLYSTEYLEKTNYSLLYDRIKLSLKLFDLIRLDHFQAFAKFFAIPISSEANFGHWERGVGEPFIKLISENFGSDRFIAEDFNCFPGGSYDLAMKYSFADISVLEFTLSSGKSPQDYHRNTVAYTGTHDTDTLLGYFNSLDDKALKKCASIIQYKNIKSKKELVNESIKRILASDANRVVIQMQDLLFQDSNYRMNKPGVSNKENWTYRLGNKEVEYLKNMEQSYRIMLKESNRI